MMVTRALALPVTGSSSTPMNWPPWPDTGADAAVIIAINSAMMDGVVLTTP